MPDYFSHEEDIALMNRIHQAQEQTALNTLYTQYSNQVYSLVYRVLNNGQMAEEITQDVFVYIWQDASRWDSTKGKLINWILTIARNRAIDRIRKEKRRPQIVEAELSDIPQYASKPALVNDTLWQNGQVLRQLMAQLPIEQSEIINYAFFQGMTHREIADKFNIPLGTVKSRARSGLQKLKSMWLAEGNKPPSV